MPSPPKPWEVNSGTAVASTPVVSNMSTTETTTTVPTVPNRPSTAMGLGSTMNSGYGSTMNSGYGSTMNSGYGGYGGYGSSYGGYGSTGGYGSSYNRYGGGYGSSYGGYGSSYGGGYGGYGSSYGMGGMGGFGPNGPMEDGLSQRMESSTRATFDVIQSIVGAFGGFAQMLDSTYMATHSSFMAMVGVAEQFGNLRHYLGGIFSIFALVRWVKRMLYRVTGRTPPPELLPPPESEEVPVLEGQTSLQITKNGEAETTTEQQPVAVSRKKPIIIFLALVTGLPYLIYKLIQRSTQLRLQRERMMIPQHSPPQLAVVMHDFIAENPIELTISRGEHIHVLSQVDPATGQPCDWWQGRNQNGTIGIFPANYVQLQGY